jgi:hypothetical protein
MSNCSAAAEAAATGQLKVSEDECRDIVWAMTDGHLWHQLVVERGWSDEQYADWLGRTWVAPGAIAFNLCTS